MFRLLVCALLLMPLATLAQDKAPPSNPNTDTEQDFYSEPEPPAEPLPDDTGLEYADEAPPEEPVDQDEPEAESEKKSLRERVVQPPLDEPLPLIKRKREKVEYSIKPPPKRIQHPNASKGLTKITKDKVYIYKVPTSEQSKASSFRFGLISLDNLKSPDTGSFFGDYYDIENFAFIYDYEWQIFQKFGKLGIKVGTGLSVANGNGQWRDPTVQGTFEPQETFSFFMIPATLGAVYRFNYWPNQILVPYGEGGGCLIGFAETRDDNKGPKFGGAFGAYAAGGAALDLGFLDRISMLELDREYGINRVFLLAEFRYIIGMGNYDFTTTVINGGFMAEF